MLQALVERRTDKDYHLFFWIALIVDWAEYWYKKKGESCLIECWLVSKWFYFIFILSFMLVKQMLIKFIEPNSEKQSDVQRSATGYHYRRLQTTALWGNLSVIESVCMSERERHCNTVTCFPLALFLSLSPPLMHRTVASFSPNPKCRFHPHHL